ARQERSEGRMRAIAVSMILFAGLLVGAAVVRRARFAEREARRLREGPILYGTGAAPWLGGFFVFLMFALAAAIAFSRGCIV
ncbi:MAG: hypothetical protein AAF938_25950, partial [Myxococcota bacterium]